MGYIKNEKIKESILSTTAKELEAEVYNYKALLEEDKVNNLPNAPRKSGIQRQLYYERQKRSY